MECFESSVQLTRQACDLLPLHFKPGRPLEERAALPDSPDTRWRLLTAFVMAARADYVTPFPLMSGRDEIIYLSLHNDSLVSLVSMSLHP